MKKKKSVQIIILFACAILYSMTVCYVCIEQYKLSYYNYKLFYSTIALSVCGLFIIILMWKKLFDKTIYKLLIIATFAFSILLNLTTYVNYSGIPKKIITGTGEGYTFTSYDFYYKSYQSKYMSQLEAQSFSGVCIYELIGNRSIVINEDGMLHWFTLAVVIRKNYEYDVSNSKVEINQNYLVEQSAIQLACFSEEGAELGSIYVLAPQQWEENDSVYILSGLNDLYVFSDSQLKEGINSGEIILIDSKVYKELKSQNASLITLAQGNNFHEELFAPSMVSNILFVMFIWICGFILLVSFFENIPFIRIFLAFPLGSLVAIPCAILSGVIFGKIYLSFILGVCLLPLAYMIYKKRLKYKFYPSEIWCMAALLLVIVFFIFFPKVVITYDSLIEISIGNSLGIEGFSSYTGKYICTYSMFFPVISAIAARFGVFFNYIFLPVFSLCGIITLFMMHVKMVQKIKCPNALKLLFGLLGIGIYATVPMALTSNWWMLNNWAIGIFQGLATASVVLCVKQREEIYIRIGLPLFVFAHMIRMEGPLFGIFFLVSMWSIEEIRPWVKKYSYALFIAEIVRFVYYYVTIPNPNPVFWTPLRDGVVIVALLAWCLWITFYSKINIKKYMKYISYLNEKMDYIATGALISFILVMMLAKTTHGMTNLVNLLYTTCVLGYYGGFWLFLAALLFCEFGKKKKIERLLCSYIRNYALALFLLMFFRGTLNTAYGDSGCRLVLHILPSAGIYIFLILCEELLEKGCKNEKKI